MHKDDSLYQPSGEGGTRMAEGGTPRSAAVEGSRGQQAGPATQGNFPLEATEPPEDVSGQRNGECRADRDVLLSNQEEESIAPWEQVWAVEKLRSCPLENCELGWGLQWET